MQFSRPGESTRLITDKEVFVLVVMNQSKESGLDKGSRSEKNGKFPIMDDIRK